MITKAPKGTADILPSQAYKWQYIENQIKKICEEFCIKEIRTPVFEHTELFERGVGDTTDVVGKEMYTFNDKGDRSITLRPEGTASAARAYIEHGLFNEPQPVKVYYLIKCYRYEKPQAGRYREFSQFGVEVYGSREPSVDAEIMALPMVLYKRLGLKNLTLNINSIGCPVCRKEYNKKLKEFLTANYDNLCDTCKERFDKNPMRIIDCKSPICKDIVKGAPKLLDCICDECSDHFEKVKKNLTAMGIEYRIDPYIVRGLDYYTKTVFEIIADNKNSNSTVCGGGRYDGLIEELGGNSMPACGFALGMERLLLTMEEQGVEIPGADVTDIYIGNIGEESNLFAQSLVMALREKGVIAEKDHLGKSVKAQMKYANKINARYSMIIGDTEIAEGKVRLKNMTDGTETECTLTADEIAGAIK
ncbi:MAG: histidine--tRNA ligase [Ruminococcaceae bacterium]|nr:histidine--tRNA ligase [Oscillospiraceae bacterium]